MPRVIQFEIPVDQPERAISFYANVFGWEIKKWPGPRDYWLIKEGEGSKQSISGGLVRRTSSSIKAINTIDVPSLDESTLKIIENGGQIVVSKMAIPGVGFIAYCQDTEGNTFGIVQEDWSAQG